MKQKAHFNYNTSCLTIFAPFPKYRRCLIVLKGEYAGRVEILDTIETRDSIESTESIDTITTIETIKKVTPTGTNILI